jgi:hypothetical protein
MSQQKNRNTKVTLTQAYVNAHNTYSSTRVIKPLNAELNPICHLLALTGAHHFVHVSRLRVKPFVKMEHSLHRLTCFNTCLYFLPRGSRYNPIGLICSSAQKGSDTLTYTKYIFRLRILRSK